MDTEKALPRRSTFFFAILFLERAGLSTLSVAWAVGVGTRRLRKYESENGDVTRARQLPVALVPPRLPKAFDNRPFFRKFCLKVFHFLHKLIHNAWQIRGEHVDGRPRIVASIWARIVDDRHWADVTRDHLRMVWDMITQKFFNALLRDGGHMAAERAHDVPTLALIIQLQHLGHAPIANALATAAQTAASGLSVTL